jgi:hypothetical protein
VLHFRIDVVRQIHPYGFIQTDGIQPISSGDHRNNFITSFDAQVSLKRAIAATPDAIFVGHLVLAGRRSSLLPSAAMPRGAAGGARGGAEFGAGLARVGWLEDFAPAAGFDVVGRGFARRGAAGAIGQGFRAVHFVEVGFVDAGGGVGTARGMRLTPTL